MNRDTPCLEKVRRISMCSLCWTKSLNSHTLCEKEAYSVCLDCFHRNLRLNSWVDNLLLIFILNLSCLNKWMNTEFKALVKWLARISTFLVFVLGSSQHLNQDWLSLNVCINIVHFLICKLINCLFCLFIFSAKTSCGSRLSTVVNQSSDHLYVFHILGSLNLSFIKLVPYLSFKLFDRCSCL